MSDTLRILMVCPQFRPLVGGYERAAERLAIALVERGHTVDVVTDRIDPRWPAEEWIEGVRIVRICSLRQRILQTASVVLSLVGFLARHGRRYDVFHVHQYGWMGATTVACGLVFGRPVVLKLTSTEATGIGSLPSGGLTGLVSRGLHRRVAACVTTSARAADEARAFGIPSDRIRRIPNALDTETYRPAEPGEREDARARLGLEGDFVGVYVGRLSAEKNATLAVRAWTDLAARHPGATLGILGTGPSEDEVRAAAEGEPAVRVLGNVPDPVSWYRAADVFLLPSHQEGLSNSLMEAMGCGLPVVSTRVSGAEDVFAETEIGRLVEVGDERGFADAARRGRGRAGATSRLGRERAALRVRPLCAQSRRRRDAHHVPRARWRRRGAARVSVLAAALQPQGHRAPDWLDAPRSVEAETGGPATLFLCDDAALASGRSASGRTFAAVVGELDAGPQGAADLADRFETDANAALEDAIGSFCALAFDLRGRDADRRALPLGPAPALLRADGSRLGGLRLGPRAPRRAAGRRRPRPRRPHRLPPHRRDLGRPERSLRDPAPAARPRGLAPHRLGRGDRPALRRLAAGRRDGQRRDPNDHRRPDSRDGARPCPGPGRDGLPVGGPRLAHAARDRPPRRARPPAA